MFRIILDHHSRFDSDFERKVGCVLAAVFVDHVSSEGFGNFLCSIVNMLTPYFAVKGFRLLSCHRGRLQTSLNKLCLGNSNKLST